MTKAETAKLIGILVMAYPNYDKFKDEKHIRTMTDVWSEMFEEDDSKLVAMAVKKHISISKWPPAIAEIREIMSEIINPDVIPTDEAWVIVSKLLYTEGENSHIDLYQVLPRMIAEAVNAIGYGQLYALYTAYARGNMSKVGLDRIAFIQAYEAKIERQKKKSMLPKKLIEQIETVSAAMSDGSQILINKLSDRASAKDRQFAKFENGWENIDKLEFDEQHFLALDSE